MNGLFTRARDRARGLADAASVRLRGWAVRGLALALGLGGALAILIAVGQTTRERLRQDERFRLPFTAVECQPSPPVARAEFLAEVQYLAELPDELYLLETDLPSRLAGAFARHPWVERVERVMIEPSRQVKVQLVYRRPVLAVRVDGQTRAVDRDGVLLPAKANVTGLPRFPKSAPPPAGPAGTRWGDPAVEQAARHADAATP